mmetsp:Transcript_30519/g.90546  ORF Transcript_30519/g.90546 Transcript_30519/m.90546 type:complete len:693 (-) Transcript_30519:83-2161(-)
MQGLAIRAASVLLAHHLGEGHVLAGVGGERDAEVDDLLGIAAVDLALVAHGLLLRDARGVDAREVGASELLAVHLGVACQVADAAGATLVVVDGSALGHRATDGAPLGALGPLLVGRGDDAVDGAGVPDDQVARLRDVLGLLREGEEVAVVEVDEDRGVADRLVSVRAADVLRRAVVVLAALVHGDPPAHGVGEVDRAVLVVLVPAEALVGVDEQHVRRAAHLIGAAELCQAVAERGVVEEVAEAVVRHPHVALDVVVEAAHAPDEGPDVRVLDLELRDRAQEAHPGLHGALDHDHAVLLVHADLLLGELQALAHLARHDARGERHVRVLHPRLEREGVDGLLSDGVVAREAAALLACQAQAARAVEGHEAEEHREHRAADEVVLVTEGADDLVLDPRELGEIHANGAASGHILRADAGDGDHREAAVHQLLELLLGELPNAGRGVHVAGTVAHVVLGAVVREEEAVAAVGLEHGHDLEELREALLLDVAVRQHTLQRRRADNQVQGREHRRAPVHELGLAVPLQLVEVLDAEVLGDLIEVVVLGEPQRIEAEVARELVVVRVVREARRHGREGHGHGHARGGLRLSRLGASGRLALRHGPARDDLTAGGGRGHHDRSAGSRDGRARGERARLRGNAGRAGGGAQPRGRGCTLGGLGGQHEGRAADGSRRGSGGQGGSGGAGHCNQSGGAFL